MSLFDEDNFVTIFTLSNNIISLKNHKIIEEILQAGIIREHMNTVPFQQGNAELASQYYLLIQGSITGKKNNNREVYSIIQSNFKSRQLTCVVSYSPFLK